MLQKLGREDDAYHAVALVLPDLSKSQEAPGDEVDAAGPLPAGEAPERPEPAQVEPDVPDVVAVPWVASFAKRCPTDSTLVGSSRSWSTASWTTRR